MFETLLVAAVLSRPNPIIELEPEVIETEQVIEVEIEPTIEEKIASNFYKCDESVSFIRADTAECLAKPVYVATPSVKARTSAVNASSGLLVGTYGSVRAYGNCVNEPGVNNPGRGNPITWSVLSGVPTVGATALWTYNHTGVVTGIYEGGEYIEVRHQNYRGMRTKFHISEFRGYR